MWILNHVTSKLQLQVFTDFNEQIHQNKDKKVHIDFINSI